MAEYDDPDTYSGNPATKLNVSEGTKIVCISPIDDLIKDKVYTVKGISNPYDDSRPLVCVEEGKYSGYFLDRFVLA